MLINGVPGDQVSIHDRGLQYGDGVFRTLRILNGHILHWPLHYLKLKQDCAALKLPCPEAVLLHDELQRLATQQPDAIAKIIITRGLGARGYAPPGDPIPTRILSLAPPRITQPIFVRKASACTYAACAWGTSPDWPASSTSTAWKIYWHRQNGMVRALRRGCCWTLRAM